MTRPVYESKLTLQNERDVTTRLAARWNLMLRKTPDFYPLDFALSRPSPPVRDGKIERMLEVKCRSRFYPSMFLSASKLAFAGSLLNVGLVTTFAWAALETDGDWRVLLWDCDTLRREVTFEWGGRSDRGDAADREPMALVPCSIMRGVPLRLEASVTL
jgi:hypothetical protein